MVKINLNISFSGSIGISQRDKAKLILSERIFRMYVSVQSKVLTDILIFW